MSKARFTKKVNEIYHDLFFDDISAEGYRAACAVYASKADPYVLEEEGEISLGERDAIVIALSDAHI